MAVGNGPRRWHAWAVIVGVGVVALVIRWYYVLHADVLQPAYLPEARGDAVDYYRYAWNLAHHGLFARDVPGAPTIHPDGFRDPGYPWLMSLWLRVLDDWQAFYGAMLLMQAVLGAATVSLLLTAFHRILSTPWLVVAGFLMAVWPHSVAATSFLLSEVLFAFLVALALACIVEAATSRSAGWALAAGLAFGAASLTNAVLMPFAPLLGLATALYVPAHRRWAVVLAVTALVGPLAWNIRNMADVPATTSVDRATMNLVQGSWPSYHASFHRAMAGEPDALAEMQSIDREIAAFGLGTVHGLHAIAERMSAAPFSYARWYLSKPALLWQWDIRMGSGDVYTYATRHSPFRENALMIAIWSVCHAMNPILALLALGACLGALLFPQGRHEPAWVVTALLLLWVTTIYTMLQSEPRYSVAFRGEEIILAMLSVQMAFRQLARTRQRRNLVSQFSFLTGLSAS